MRFLIVAAFTAIASIVPSCQGVPDGTVSCSNVTITNTGGQITASATCATPSAPPTETPTTVPTATPTATATIAPTPNPTATPTATPSATSPTIAPPTPTPPPTATPSIAPIASPTVAPTIAAIPAPTPTPTPSTLTVTGTVIYAKFYSSSGGFEIRTSSGAAQWVYTSAPYTLGISVGEMISATGALNSVHDLIASSVTIMATPSPQPTIAPSIAPASPTPSPAVFSVAQAVSAPDAVTATLQVPDGVDAALTAQFDIPCAQVDITGGYTITLSPVTVGACTLTISNGAQSLPFTISVQ